MVEEHHPDEVGVALAVVPPEAAVLLTSMLGCLSNILIWTQGDEFFGSNIRYFTLTSGSGRRVWWGGPVWGGDFKSSKVKVNREAMLLRI